MARNGSSIHTWSEVIAWLPSIRHSNARWEVTVRPTGVALQVEAYVSLVYTWPQNHKTELNRWGQTCNAAAELQVMAALYQGACLANQYYRDHADDWEKWCLWQAGAAGKDVWAGHETATTA